MDNSDEAYRAVKRTIEIVKNQKSMEKAVKNNNLTEIIAFHSTEHRKLSEKLALYVPSSFGSNYSIPPIDYRKIQEEYEIHGRQILEKTNKLFDEKYIEIETRLITDEKPEDYLEKMVKKENIDLVVLGSKGEHSKLEQIFSGTIAQNVVNDVPCDVLIVR
jgi:nucleotide-binding universal stress UspA family protein